MKSTKAKRKRNRGKIDWRHPDDALISLDVITPWVYAAPSVTPPLSRRGIPGPFGKLGGDDARAKRSGNAAKSRKPQTIHTKRYKFPQKRLGPMSNKAVGERGLQTIDDSTNGVSTFSQQNVTAVLHTLAGVVSNSGDFKHPTAQEFQKNDYLDFEGTVSRHGPNTDFRVVSGAAQQPFSPPPEFFLAFPHGGTYNRAVGKLYEKLRGDLDVSIDLAESHKTKHMMMDTFKAMKNLSLTFHKMKRSNPRDWGNLWLEFTYGWKPLAQSIYGTGHRLLVEPTLSSRIKVVASQTDRFNYSQLIPGTFYAVGDKLYFHAAHSSRCRLVIYYGIAPNRLDSLAGFTSLNPVSIAWELTPYSFVVDWFLNIGGYLRNFESALLYGSSFVSGYMTQTQLSQFSGYDIGGSTVGNVTYTVDLQGNQRSAYKKRTVLNGTPYPHVPRFEPRLGASRLISAASLLGQQLHSLKHPREAVQQSVWRSTWTGVFDWLGVPGVSAGNAPSKPSFGTRVSHKH